MSKGEKIGFAIQWIGIGIIMGALLQQLLDKWGIK